MPAQTSEQERYVVGGVALMPFTVSAGTETDAAPLEPECRNVNELAGVVTAPKTVCIVQ